MSEKDWEQLAHDLAEPLRLLNNRIIPWSFHPNGEFVDWRPYDDLLARYDAMTAGGQAPRTPDAND